MYDCAPYNHSRRRNKMIESFRQHKDLGLGEVVRQASKILEMTPEDWLEFSAGQNTKFNLARFRVSPLKAFFLQFVGFFHLLICSARISRRSIGQKDVMFFGSSVNQISVLQPIYNECADISKVFIVPKVFQARCESLISSKVLYGVDSRYMVAVMYLLFRRSRYLLRALLLIDKRLIVHRIKSFWSVYLWLVYHQVLLNEIRPRMVMMSNDHNPETRALIELCKLFGIKTGYVPHAGVSMRFHSLDFDYSFLDGEHALETYKACDRRRSPNSKVLHQRRCYLVGNLRKVRSAKESAPRSPTVGLAVKGTDTLKNVEVMIVRLAEQAPVVLRPHPNLKSQKYEDLISNISLPNVTLSDPSVDDIETFFNSVTTVISGNSTLLLEAASIGKAAIYLGDLSGGVYDYYGYVARNVVPYYSSMEELIAQIEQGEDWCASYPSESGVRYYWSSYKTQFENQEANIIADLISKVVNNGDDPSPKYKLKWVDL